MGIFEAFGTMAWVGHRVTGLKFFSKCYLMPKYLERNSNFDFKELLF